MIHYLKPWRNASKYFLISVVALTAACSDDDDNGKRGPEIWKGAETTFTKESDADWTLPANQDKISSKVILTRQDRGPLYNYQWWLDTFSEDAVFEDISHDFWGGEDEDEVEKDFTPVGGTNGVRWALLDDTGAEDTDAWREFNMYGKLGDPANYYSFHNIASIIRYLDDNDKILNVTDDFNLEIECDDCDEPNLVSSTTMA